MLSAVVKAEPGPLSGWPDTVIVAACETTGEVVAVMAERVGDASGERWFQFHINAMAVILDC